MPTTFGNSMGSGSSGGSGGGAALVNAALAKSERPAGGFLARAESSKVNIGAQGGGGNSSSFGGAGGGNLNDQFDRLDINDRSYGKQGSFDINRGAPAQRQDPADRDWMNFASNTQ